MPLRLPRPNDRLPILPAVAGAVLVGSVLLARPSPVDAATILQDPAASPTTGTTETVFVLSVGYLSESDEHDAASVAVEIVGLGGGPLPMTRVSGTATNGTWETSTMLPVGSWQLVFSASSDGPPPQQPDAIDGPVVTVTEPAATPTPTSTPAGPTPSPTAAPTQSPSSTATPRPTATALPTPSATPLPPGVTPAPTIPPSPPASPGPSGNASASPAGDATTGPSPSDRAHEPEPPSSGRPDATRSPTDAPGDADGEPDEGASRSGWGQAPWVVLGGVTSAAGVAVLARQWLARRSARLRGGLG